MKVKAKTTTALLAAALALLWCPSAAAAQAAAPPSPDQQFAQIISNLRVWLLGLLGVGATLMLTVAGWLYLTAGGNPPQIERAKIAFRSALVGYAIAFLAPIFVGILQGLLG